MITINHEEHRKRAHGELRKERGYDMSKVRIRVGGIKCLALALHRDCCCVTLVGAINQKIPTRRIRGRTVMRNREVYPCMLEVRREVCKK